MTPATALNNFALRLGSGLILFICSIAMIFHAQPWLFRLFMMGIVLLIGAEWLHLARLKSISIRIGLAITLLGMLVFTASFAYPLANRPLLLWLLGCWYSYAFAQTLCYAADLPLKTSPLWTAGQGLLWLILFYSYALLIHQLSPWLALLGIAIVCAIDMGGYAGGKLCGGRKLCPRLSPHKTYAGVIGGIVFCYLVYGLMLLFFPFLPASLEFTLLLFPFSLISQAGDLYQSMLKRQANMKDSGNWIPGHGGIFDRTDALLFGVPAFYYLLVLCGLAS